MSCSKTLDLLQELIDAVEPEHKKEEQPTSPDRDNTLLWLRNETKYGESRVTITPENAKKLLNAGYRVYVERSSTRCIPNEEYVKVGCKLVATNSWPNAPIDAYVVGLKGLPVNEPKLLEHRHIYFSHSFKGQTEAIPLLKRFINGKGEILDYEYLTDNNGKEIAYAMSTYAGKNGMAMALLTWANQILNESFSEIKPFKSEQYLIETVNRQLLKALDFNKNISFPRVVIIGAFGRCGQGAIEIAEQCGIEQITKWGSQETKAGGPFPSIVNQHEILVNCIKLRNKIAPFITKQLCNNKKRKLTVISDVACDPNNPYNPLPVYDKITTVREPISRLVNESNEHKVLDITAIDHLPSLTPLEASIQFSNHVISTLMNLTYYMDDKVWRKAKDSYLDAINKLSK